MLKSRFARLAAAAASVTLAAALAAPSAMAYPPNPTAPRILGPGVLVVSQQVANQVTQRTLLKPAGTSLKKAPDVSVRRGAVLALIVKFLVPRASYRVSVRIVGDWELAGRTKADAKGVAELPAIAFTRRGEFPVRLISAGDPKSPLFINVVVK
jgi:hypothetical protein